MKRYVLLEDKRIFNGAEIVDAGNYNGKRVIHSDDKGYFLGYMEKESDNLIDLLEVGDMVEYINNENGLVKYEIAMDNNVLLYFKKYTVVIAIWKRNGDVMRRYSVE